MANPNSRPLDGRDDPERAAGPGAGPLASTGRVAGSGNCRAAAACRARDAEAIQAAVGQLVQIALPRDNVEA